MRIVVAPTSFKGSIGVIDACIAIIRGIREVYPQVDITQFPLSDGGDGFLESLLFNCGGEFIDAVITDPHGRRRDTVCGLLKTGIGIVEMAKASGLALLSENEKNPLLTTSYGTGELINVLVKRGVKKIIVGVGGSATIDMGIGCMQAIGVRFLDEVGKDVGYGGREITSVKGIDRSQIREDMRDIELIIAADVKNILLGSEGAVLTYGKQKGLVSKETNYMEDAIKNIADVIKKEFGKDVTAVRGGGAAGGVAAGLYGVLDAEIRDGIDIFFEITGFRGKTKNKDLIITGEGRFDSQTGYGKVVQRILLFGEENNIFVIVLAGEITEKAEKHFKKGKSFGISITPKNITQEEAKKRVEELLQEGTVEALYNLKNEVGS
ncbi:glycerate kinase [candidate division WOR-3 bacterium]|nr:glycerate kinase [candidate division WOR-3 bacterium]